MFKRSKRRTRKPLGIYVTRYWQPEIKQIVVVLYEVACQYAMTMQVKDVRRLMHMYYEHRRSDFLENITQLKPHERYRRRIQLLALRAFRNDYRVRCEEFDSENPGWVSRY